MRKLKFGTALPEDAEEIMKLYKSMIGTKGCTWTDKYPSMEILISDISKGNEFCMKDIDGTIVAVIAIDDDKKVERLSVWSREYKNAGELSRLAVREDFKNHGVAKEIILCVRKEMEKRGYDGIHFLASKTNLAALACYKKIDVKIVGEVYLYERDWWCYEGKVGNLA